MSVSWTLYRHEWVKGVEVRETKRLETAMKMLTDDAEDCLDLPWSLPAEVIKVDQDSSRHVSQQHSITICGFG